MACLFVGVPLGKTFFCPPPCPLRKPNKSPREYVSLKSLRKHARDHHDGASVEYVCRVCFYKQTDNGKCSNTTEVCAHLLHQHQLPWVSADLPQTLCAWRIEDITGRPPGGCSPSPSPPTRCAGTAAAASGRAYEPPGGQATNITPLYGGLPCTSPQASPPRQSPIATLRPFRLSPGAPPAEHQSPPPSLLVPAAAAEAPRRPTTPLHITPEIRHQLHAGLTAMMRQVQASASPAATPRRSPSPRSATVVASRLRRAHLSARTPPALRRSPVIRNVLLPSPPPIQAAPPASTPDVTSSPRRPPPTLSCSQQLEPTHVSPTPSGFGFIPNSPSERPANRYQDQWVRKLGACSTFAEFEGVVGELTKQLQPPPKRQRPGGPRGRGGQGRRPQAQEAKRIQLLYKRNRKKAMREIRQEDSPLCDVPGEDVANHFEDVFKESMTTLGPPPASAVLPPTLQQEPRLVSAFDKDTIVARLGRCSDTAPGSDGISYSILRRKDPGAHILHAIFNSCLHYRKIPSEWKTARTILLYKKGDKGDLGNWRPIALSSCLYKLYSGILADRLGRWAALTGAVSKVQKGFMPAEGCLEHNFIIQQAIDDVQESGRELTITWLDLRNAFGSVPHVVILEMLRQHGVHDHLVDVIKDAYQGCTTNFVTATGETRFVPMASGVKQGDPLSPITFNLALEALIRSLDRELKRVAKAALHLPQRASAEPVYLPPHKGGANLLPLGDLTDIGAIVHAFKVLTCPDPLVRNVAEASARKTVKRLLGHPPSNEELATVLSGAPTPRGVHNASNIWTAARNASRRLSNKIAGFKWGWSASLERLEVHVPFPGKPVETAIVDAESRKHLHHKLRQALQHHYLVTLVSKPDQGKVYAAACRDPASNHFYGAGQHMRFCDWRFIHRARLGVLPLNGCVRGIAGRARSCRACGHPDETTAHVLNHCFAKHSVAINNRHRAILKNILEVMGEGVRRNTRVERCIAGSGSADKPDIVVMDNNAKTALIVDICCPYEKRYHALEVARRYKEVKYDHLVQHLKGRGFEASAAAIVVGSLGSWDPANNPVLNQLGIPKFRQNTLKRKCVSDAIRWSRDIYVEHVTQRRQFTQNVTLTAH
ncbi:Retrovirus-related Pol polyprotein from type-2 retrotransposable element R2DM [Frankliniella fusca]|uniref:Retrovirus-related Pol polyprotein from type-2 retrotransposable element R2DM n=2 Tax=Frankliniella fusca TaxID=407009 RepID=A0AAE1HKY0_9NEOP|nr:Retrovirus-related Pol polyprotein from type-2 retrotransposable element R2DM [Frankliniella fusca]